MTPSPEALSAARRPVTVLVAAGVGLVFALALLAVAVVLVYDTATGTGHIGHEHLTGRARGGPAGLAGSLVVGCIVLAVGAVRLLTKRRRLPLGLPLAAIVCIGCVGETVDAPGPASTSSDLIGLAILVGAATPVALLLAPSSSRWATKTQ